MDTCDTGRLFIHGHNNVTDNRHYNEQILLHISEQVQMHTIDAVH